MSRQVGSVCGRAKAYVAIKNIFSKGAATHARRRPASCAMVVLVVTLWISDGYAQEPSNGLARLQPMLQQANPRWTDLPHRPDTPDDSAVQMRTMNIFIASALAIGLYGKSNWWRDGFNGSFRAVDEGWFGPNTYAGGADKLGHFYMNYAGTRLFARAFKWAGNTPSDALTRAAWLTLGTFTAVEIVDGYSKKWRFSKEDAVMNAFGVGAAFLLEKNPELDRLLDLRLLYQPSHEPNRHIDPFGDYSGQTYLVVAKASGVPALRQHPLLRYAELALGYGARGYSDNGPVPAVNRSRNFYVGLSLNLSELLGETVFKQADAKSRAQRMTDTALEFVQVPGSVVFVRHKL